LERDDFNLSRKRHMHILQSSDYRRMPWKNGGGETTEIAVSPAGAGLDDFGWRVSMARVEGDGPFSAFPGVDRTLTILDGEGLRLAVAGRPAISLDAAAEPFTFPADQPTQSSLIGGPVTDLNVMTRRARFTHAVSRLTLDGAMDIRSHVETIMLLCHRGRVRLAVDGRTAELGSLDCLTLDGSQDAAIRAEADSPAVLFLIEIGSVR
jgi:environmental stress-induced protein Ves